MQRSRGRALLQACGGESHCGPGGRKQRVRNGGEVRVNGASQVSAGALDVQSSGVETCHFENVP